MIDIIKETATPSTKAAGNPDVVILLDASGSMSQQRESVVSTFNEYVQSVKDTAHSISLYTFDSKGIFEKIYKENPSRIKKLTTDDYKPDAMTPLYDAMGKVMTKFEESNRNVQFVTHTDGLENDSKEWSYAKLKEYIDILTKKGWLFVYLGEGVEGKSELQKFEGLKVNFSSQNRGVATESLKAVTRRYASHGFTSAECYASHGDSIDADAKNWQEQLKK